MVTPDAMVYEGLVRGRADRSDVAAVCRPPQACATEEAADDAHLGSGPRRSNAPPCQARASSSTSSLIGGRSECSTLTPKDVAEEAPRASPGEPPMKEEHFAILRRHMVEVIGIYVDLAEELGRSTLDEGVMMAIGRVPREAFVRRRWQRTLTRTPRYRSASTRRSRSPSSSPL
jgi:hypothetical protein